MPRLTAAILVLGMALLASSMPVAARAPIALGIADPKGPTMDAVDAHEAAVGQTPALWALWSNWGSRGGRRDCVEGSGNCFFPVEKVRQLQDRGIVPVIWWQPTNPSNPLSGAFSRYKRILSGKHDAYITQWAREAKKASIASGLPIIIRFAHEATGPWFPWGIGRFDNTTDNYKRAWRYVVKRFARVGARPHVRFLWSHLKPREKAYPGDAYVDYVGFTVLNFGKFPRHNWRTMKNQVRARVAMAAKFTKKPIILPEVASGHRGGNKARWLKSGYLDAYQLRRIKGIVYLDSNQPMLEINHPDWRLIKPSDLSAQKMYGTLAANPKFKGKIK
jgi:hypothetical protein